MIPAVETLKKPLPVEALKSLLVAAINQLPDEIPAWEEADGDGQALGRSSVSQKKAASLGRMEEAARLAEIFSGRKVIAMVGNVNAGKSSLGNFLLGKAASEVFAEDDIRATAEASIADYGEDVLIDLPGLGSVLSASDDKIVNEYVTRADVLLIVQHIGSDIDPVLYTFLKEAAQDPQKRGQRIIIVFNKTDTLHPASLEKTLGRYQEVLLDGAKGFAGIRQLFGYPIPMIPFSVFDARNGLLPPELLREAIDGGIEASGGDSSRKYWDELKIIREEWRYVPVLAAELAAAAENCLQEKNQQRDNLLNELVEKDTVRIQLAQVEKGLDQEAVAALNSMKGLPGPNYVEKARKFAAGAGPKYIEKYDAFVHLCDTTVQSMEKNYRSDLRGYLKAMANLIRTYYPDTAVPKLSSLDDGVLTGYQALMQLKRDQYLDKLFDGEKVADTTHQRWVNDAIANIRRAYQLVIQQYDRVVREHIQSAYTHSLAEVDQWKEAQNTIAPFSARYQEMTDLIHRAEQPEPTPIAEPETIISTTSPDNNSSMIAIILVVLVLIVIIIVAVSHH